MFSKKYRLRDTKEIARVFKTGKHIHGNYVLIKYTANKQETTRIATSVSAKIFKRAVKRNQIKRQIREAIKPHLLKLPPMDILIIAKKELIADTRLKNITTDISNVLSKLTLPKF